MAQIRNSDTDRSNGENGAADTLGGVLLISVIAIGISIAGVALFSSPMPGKVPAFDVTVTNTTDTILLTHDGGDVIRQGQFKILVDGRDLVSEGVFFKGGAMINDWTSCDWSLGESIRYTSPDGKSPARLTILYTGDGNPRVMRDIYCR